MFEASLYDTQYQFFSKACREGTINKGNAEKYSLNCTRVPLCTRHENRRAVNASSFSTDGQKRVARKGNEEFNGIKLIFFRSSNATDMI